MCWLGGSQEDSVKDLRVFEDPLQLNLGRTCMAAPKLWNFQEVLRENRIEWICGIPWQALSQ